MANTALPFEGGQLYNKPNGEPSSIGTQFNTQYWLRRSLIDARKEQIYTQLADTETMPKHMGKEIVAYHYIPLLDDRNVNDQGIDAAGVKIKDGNLYGSSKDVGKILDKMPYMGEEGGRVNRVGTVRLEIKGSISKMGIFREWTKDSIDFDTDPMLMKHMQRELVTGAVQITEDMLEIELLQGAGTIMFAGVALKDDQVTGEGAVISEVTFENLQRLDDILNENRTPRNTDVIKGSPFTDTKTIPSARYMYIGNELLSTIRNMKDNFGNPAFIPVQHYAAAGHIANGEVGTVGPFRVIVNFNAKHFAGKGAAVTNKDTIYRNTDDKYDIFPMMVVGGGSFTTVGFEAAGRQYKFQSITKVPGEQTADRHDPYGQTGFTSMLWWYGMLILRSERLAMIKTVARI